MRPGIQTEILVSLGVVMLLATVVLAAVLAAQHEAELRRVLGRALVAEAAGARPLGGGVVPGTEWWLRDADGGVRPRGPVRASLDAESEALAREAARRREPLLRPGAPWEVVRFAAPTSAGAVAVARLPRDASWRMRMAPLLVLGLVLLADAMVVTALGGALLGRRVVQPLQRVAAAARAVAEGADGMRVREEGARETADLARSFNEMNEALEARREALRKAVVELREANAELRTARAGLDRAERLAAVGQLAAGVAHEVGNPIGAMLAFLDLAGRDPDAGEATRGHLARAAREGERVRRILRQLLDFSRPPRGEPTDLDLVAVAEEARGLVAAQRRFAGVAFAVEADGPLPAVRADPGAVTQVLLNLLLNAGDAAAGGEGACGGRVVLRLRAVSTGPCRAGDADGGGAAARRPDAVECVVADDGPGIPEEDRERVFHPFVTGKPPGEGTGLGLPNALRLAEEQGGSLELVAPPQGFRTAFALRLPAVRPPEARVRGEDAEGP